MKLYRCNGFSYNTKLYIYSFGIDVYFICTGERITTILQRINSLMNLLNYEKHIIEHYYGSNNVTWSKNQETTRWKKPNCCYQSEWFLFTPLEKNNY